MNIFITGGSSGIGRCLAQALGRAHDITAPARSSLDLSQYPNVPLQDHDVIILCAGTDLGGRQPFMTMQDSDWQNTMQVNLLSNLKLIKDFVSARGQTWSKIVVIGSATTDHLRHGMLPYTVSKLALEQFCRGLRQEIHSAIGISIVRPGLVKTNFHRNRHRNKISESESDQWYDSQCYLMPERLVSIVESILDDRTHSLREITVSNGYTGKE